MSYDIENQNQGGDEQSPNQNFGQQFNSMINTLAGSGIPQWLGGILGQDSRTNRAYHREHEMMMNQYELQRLLNQQGHELQYDMWKKTSFPAQVRMMKAAGLNPALMYKQGGPGGVTGSQTGGSAKGGGVPAVQPMDMQNLLMGKQAQLLDSQAKNVDKDTDLKGKEIDLKDVQIKNVSKDTLLKVQQTSYIKSQKELLEFEKDLLRLKVDKKVTGSAFVDLLTQVGLDPVNNEADRQFLQGILISLGLLRAGSDIARIWAQIKNGKVPGVDLNKSFNQNMKTNRDFNTLPPVPEGLRIPVPNR